MARIKTAAASGKWIPVAAGSGGGGGGGGGAVSSVNAKTCTVVLNATDVGAIDSTTGTIPAARVTSLAGVATSGSYLDLSNKPAAELTTNKNVANGYAGLDSGGLVPTAHLPTLPSALKDVVQNGDGTWPSRTTSGTTDRTLPVSWICNVNSGTLPAIGTGSTQAAVNDRLYITV